MQPTPMESPYPARPLSVDPGEHAWDAGYAIEAPETLETLQLESVVHNLDASLRVYARAHFFSWTQGLLQGLIRHELLICALRNGKPLSLRVDSFSTAVPDPAIFTETFLREASVAQSLIKSWEERGFRPVVCEADSGNVFARGAFSRELERIGANRLIVHGTHDADGQMTSLFAFACAPRTVAARQTYFVQLAVPFLHSAWMRTQVEARVASSESPRSAGASNITSREQEVLKWIYLGKSNIEIGTILNISPLTVKNHVQKVLRKLDVVNRAQAIGRAVELRILKP